MLCHLYMTAEEKGIRGKFQVFDIKDDNKYKYVVSWINIKIYIEFLSYTKCQNTDI